MRFISHARQGAPAVGFTDALLGGLAPDGGLYVPEDWPVVSPAEIAAFADAPYAEVAADILSRFAGDEIPRDVMRRSVRRGLRDLHPRGRRAPEAAGPGPLPARAVPRPDAGVQGRGDADPGAALRPRPRPSGAAS